MKPSEVSQEIGECDSCGVEWRSGGLVEGRWLCWKCQDERDAGALYATLAEAEK